MATYDDETLNQINDNANLLEYVEQSIELERRGDDYYGHCPLHTDLTASFTVNPAANKYYCFSCGRGGGIIRYLMDYESLSFDEAVEKASVLANIDLTKMCHSETIAYLRKVRAAMQKQKIAFEHPRLDYSEYAAYAKRPVNEWLNEGIKQEVMDKFDIRVDERQNRIVYPVYDIDGHLINIKGRTRYANYKSLKLPKYINYHSVGVMDYFQSLNLTLPDVRKSGEIIIFESIKSVMKAYGWGIKNSASAEKHTLTDEQISLLVKLHSDVVFAYDSDISYRDKDVKKNLDTLKMYTNVYVIEDRSGLLGGAEAKNSPADCGEDIFNELYEGKRKVV